MTLRDRITNALRALSGWTPDIRPDDGPSRAWLEHVNRRFKSGYRDDYSIDTTVRRATPEVLGYAMRQADHGDTEAQYQIFEEVERDPQVGRLYSKRRLSVLEHQLQISPATEKNPKAVAAAEMATEILLGKDGNGGVPELDEMLFDLTDAIGKAFSACEVVWDLDGGVFRPRRFLHWPQVNFQLGDPTVTRDDERDLIYLRTEEDPNRGLDLRTFPMGSWLVHRQKNWSQPLARAALFRSVAWYWLFKRFGTSDWSIALERWGIPPRMGKYGPGAGEADRNALWAAVQSLGKDHACILPDSATIEMIESQHDGGGHPHPAFIAYCNEQISIALVGSTMAVTQGEKGARSAVEAYQFNEASQSKLDAQKLANTIREQLVAPLVRVNMGDGVPIPLVSFLWEETEDLNEAAEMLVKLHGMNKAIPVSYVVKKFGVPEPEGDEPVLERAAPPPQLVPRETGEEEGLKAARAELVAAARQALRDSKLAEKKSSVDWVISQMLSNEP